jgi:hypothetical protein
MTLKSLLFGSAAIIAAGTGAQAADLPTAEPVEYVRICDAAYGTGFYILPGTDTCLQVSGRVRVEAHYVDEWGDDDDDDGDDLFGDDEFGINRETNNFTTLARGNVRLDARTETDFGLIRAFINLEGTIGPGAGSTTLTFEETDLGDVERSLEANYNSSAFALAEAFIQITNGAGTFTAGHAGSFFDFWGSNTFGTRVAIDDNTTEQTLFGYEFSAGGFNAGISLEDPASSGRRRESEFGPDSYEGQELPDLVVAVGGDFGFGSAQLMGALRHIHDKEDVELFEGEDDDDMFGWAIGAGLGTELGAFGFKMQIGYSEGAIGYITNDPGEAGDFQTDFDTVVFADTDADPLTPDVVVDVLGAESDTNSAFSVRAGLSAGFTETLTANLDGSYTRVETGDDDDDEFGVFAPDYDFFAVAANLVYSPAPGLIMGPEIAYNNISFDNDETDGVGDDDDLGEDSVWGAMFRIQRDF